MFHRLLNTMLALTLLTLSAAASEPTKPTTLEQTIDRIAEREMQNEKMYARFSPIVETYVQTYSHDKDLGRVPIEDRYFLGRANFGSRVAQTEDFLAVAEHQSVFRRVMQQMTEFTVRHHTGWVPLGFAQMALIDPNGFDRKHYDFAFQRREFCGELRCMVFDVTPKQRSGRGRFLGRIWVEERDYNIVRFNGTYVRPEQHTTFIHFDTWRIDVGEGRWFPALIFGEEPTVTVDGKSVGLRSQTRLWGYAASERTNNGSASSFTAIDVDAKDAVNDQAAAGSLSPLAAERAWNRQAENNVLDRLEHTGLLAPESSVTKILETVTNNILVTNNLTVEPEIRCRVLLTAPIESFTIGHTIVISRGLLDVLPDEASLAAVLAHELSHIVLAHDINTKFAFSDQLLFPDSDTLQKLAMLRPADEEADADKKSVELLRNSPYADKLAGVGLFMKQLSSVQTSLPNLVRGRLGNSFVDPKAPRLPELASNAPELQQKNTAQIAALPVGARIIVDPWTNRVDMSKAPTPAALNAHEKMPFQLTPFYPYLTYADRSHEQLTHQQTGGNE